MGCITLPPYVCMGSFIVYRVLSARQPKAGCPDRLVYELHTYIFVLATKLSFASHFSVVFDAVFVRVQSTTFAWKLIYSAEYVHLKMYFNMYLHAQLFSRN